MPTTQSEVQKARRCLSATGGRHALPAEAQKYLCLTDDQQLYVARGHEHSAWALAYREQLRREGVAYRLLIKSAREIEELYAGVGAKLQAVRQSSSRQSEILRLVQEAVNARATDIHIIISDRKTEVKFRVDGALKVMMELSAQDGSDLCATIYQTMCDVAEPVFNPRRSQDARLVADMMGGLQLYGGRVATRPTDRGLLMVIRLLYERPSSAADLTALGYLPRQVELLQRMSERKFGINILSGPTGSGKSTTLEFVMRRILKKRGGRIHMLTIEDPPEYRITGAVQTPLLGDKSDEDLIGQEWARSISNAMRLDPDVLMCGEIRDLASAKTAFRAAMTGHGVWTTLHANDALAVLTRLQDLGVSMGLLTDAALVTGLVSQVLVRRLCNSCCMAYDSKVASRLAPDQRARIEACCDVHRVRVRGSGCPHCGGEGVLGRTVVAEALEPTADLMHVYAEKGKNFARQYWLNDMKGLTKSAVLVEKIHAGEVDPRDGEEDVGLLEPPA